MSSCYLCGSQVKVERHHIDWHHENDVPENRVRLCQRCHAMLHKVGYLSGQELDSIRDKARAERTPAAAAVSGKTGVPGGRFPRVPGGVPGEANSPGFPKTN